MLVKMGKLGEADDGAPRPQAAGSPHRPGPAPGEDPERGRAGRAPEGPGLGGHLRHLRLARGRVHLLRPRAASRHRGHPGHGPAEPDHGGGAPQRRPGRGRGGLPRPRPGRWRRSSTRSGSSRASTLTAEEWRVFFLVDGRRSVSEICASWGTATSRRPCRSCTACGAAKFVAFGPAAVPRTRPTPLVRGPARAEAGGTVKWVDGKPARARGAAVRGVQSDDLPQRAGRRRHPADREPQGQALHGRRGQAHGQPAGAGEGRRHESQLPPDPRLLHPGPPPQQRHRDLRPQGLLLPRPHRPLARGLRARGPEEPQRLLGQRQARGDRAAQDRRRGPAGHGAAHLQGGLHERRERC